MNIPLSAAISVAGILAAIISALLIFNLRSIRECLTKLNGRIDDQDTRIAALNGRQTDCRAECDRNTVSKEDWVRSEGWTRSEIKQVMAAMNKLSGQLTVIEKLPQITGAIVKEVVREIQKSESQS